MLVNTQMLDSMLSASGHTQTYGPVTVTTVTETKNILEQIYTIAFPQSAYVI